MTEKRNFEINTQRAILEYDRAVDYDLLMNYLEIMIKRYGRYMSFSYCGESILGRGIPEICLGEGEKEIVYIGSHYGTDILSAVILLKFINEYCEVLRFDGRLYNYSIKYLFGTRRIRIIPMPNPDGIDIRINGVSDDNILRDRILSINPTVNKNDFSNWLGNARGVELERNYKCTYAADRTKSDKNVFIEDEKLCFCGEYPESEPEVGIICNSIRFRKSPMAVLCLEGEGEKVFYKLHGKIPRRSKSIGEAISRMSGYRLQKDDEFDDTCGFVGFCSEELEIPAYKIGYMNKRSDLQKKRGGEEYFEYYARLREVLFTLPAMV